MTMKRSTPMHHPALRTPLLAAMALSIALLAPAHVLAQGPGKPAVKPGEAVTLNFVNADIEAVARTVATLSGANVVVDPRVKGTMTLTSTLPVPPAQALRLFSAQLRTQGFALVENSGIHTVVPEADAKLQSGPVNAGQAPVAGGQVMTQIFRLNHEAANNLVPVLRPLISPNNTINVTPGSNALVITDYADNLQRLGRIIAALDVANATGVDVIRLQHGIASDMGPLVQRLIDANTGAGAPAGVPGQGDSGYRTTVLADARTNALIVRAANPSRLGLVRTLVEQLDIAPAGGPGAASGNIHVVYLKNADAARLAVTLRAALAADPRSGSGAAAGTGLTGAGAVTASAPAAPVTGAAGNPATASIAPSAQPSTGGQIQADPATNSLIISAPEPQYRQLREVIDKLDQRRAQVLVESLIAEVNADKAAQMGIQWQTASQSSNGSVGFIGTNFNNLISTTKGQGNLLSIAASGDSAAAAAVAGMGGGINIGNVRQIGGTYVLGALANFLQANGAGNILSTPTLLTLDNEEAKIVVGQNVPIVTGNTTLTNGNPFQTYERKDVGLTLRVKPQISESGTVKLTIYQEVSSVDPTTKTNTSGPTTNKRSIESNVLVDDGSIIVLGGLLSEEYTNNRDQVPGLGDVPVLGWLFKSESRSRIKKNLMVFLRPVVLRDGSAAEALSQSRYQQMIGLQQSVQPDNNPLLNPGGAPQLPPLTRTAPATTPATATPAQ
jgi:general secretion pathway protein D